MMCAAMDVGQSLEQLNEQVDLNCLRLAFTRFDDGLSVLLQLHRKERLAGFVEPVVEDVDDVWVMKRGE
jgi:hypothetical protein